MIDHCPECGCELLDPKQHSDPMRRHFFAALRDIWGSLPDHVRANYPSQEAFRKAALINTGWCDTDMIVSNSNRVAMEISASVLRRDRFAVSIVESGVVRSYWARSIAKRACPKKMFAEVSDKALHWAHGQVDIVKEKVAA